MTLNLVNWGLIMFSYLDIATNDNEEQKITSYIHLLPKIFTASCSTASTN